MKKAFIFTLLFLLIIASFVACNRNHEVEKGMYLSDLNKKYDRIFALGGINAYQIENTYAVIISQTNKVDKYAVFTTNWELQCSDGLQPIAENDLEESVGMLLSDITRKYGPYHVDVGSGFFMPAYLLEGGHIAILYVENSVITHVSIVPICDSDK